MSMDSFKIGHLVWHTALRDTGVVIADGDSVIVRFDRKTSSGKPVVGEYDRNWFDRNGTLLQHASHEDHEG